MNCGGEIGMNVIGHGYHPREIVNLAPLFYNLPNDDQWSNLLKDLKGCVCLGGGVQGGRGGCFKSE